MPDHARNRFGHDKQGVKPNRYGKCRTVAGAVVVMVVACPVTVAMIVPVPMGVAVFGRMAVIVAMIVIMPMVGFVVVACAHYVLSLVLRCTNVALPRNSQELGNRLNCQKGQLCGNCERSLQWRRILRNKVANSDNCAGSRSCDVKTLSQNAV
jgi:hypothetical protein